jgi:hypothetical protein
LIIQCIIFIEIPKSMSIFTKQQFANVAYSRTGNRSFSQVVNSARIELKSATTTSLFLSHCHTDLDVVKEAVAFFKGFNINVYVDWMDTTMPEKPNGTTATNIKSKIVTNDKFIFLATNAAITSKWCNWEIGIGDIIKFANDKFAILPLADNKGDWKGNEYLQIYPRIEAVEKTDNSIYDTMFPHCIS